ncbi:MAG: ABC transporter substrate-binding protein [Phycisphaerales bacterium]|nr:ABC transporter substrate-binding protein [Phycisphaerales bacterium]
MMNSSQMFGRRRATAALLTAAAVLSVGVGWFSTARSALADDAGKPIVIGHYGSLTGAEATFGKSTSNGIKLAIKEFNAAGGLNGRPIELREYDTKGDPKEAGTVVTRLVASDKVTAVLGEVASSLSLAGAPICQEHGVPMITPSSTNPRVTKVGDMIFRVCFIDAFQGFACARFAADRNAKRVATLFDQSSAYSEGLARDFKRAITKLGGEVPSEQRYKAGDNDFTAQLVAIRGTNPDMIFIPGYYTDVGNIAIQARRLGITCPLLGGDGWDSDQLAKIGGEAIEGAFYSNHYAAQDETPKVQDFIRKYKAEFGDIPDGLAALGYDAAKLLFDAMKRAKSLEGKDLAAAIAATRDFDAVTGNVTIGPDRNAVKSAVIVQMKNGERTMVARVEPEQAKE